MTGFPLKLIMLVVLKYTHLGIPKRFDLQQTLKSDLRPQYISRSTKAVREKFKLMREWNSAQIFR
jgi:hypothetical protein